MASDDAVNQHNFEKSNEYETSTDRSLLDFMKKDDQNESKVITTEFDDKLHVSEPKFEDCKVEEHEEMVTKPSLLQKLHRSGSSSSISSEEEVEEGGVIIKKRKEKKGLKEKIAEKIHKEEDTSVPVEVVTGPEENKGFFEKIKDKVPGDDHKVEEETYAPTPAAPVEYDTVEACEPAKKGIMDKIKEKLPAGGHKVEEETVAPTPMPTTLDHSPNVDDGEPAKKGIMEKIKEKMPGYHPKTTTEEEKKENDCA